MKCIVPGANIRVFGRAIHSLSKIGEELYIEPLDIGLALRTVNSSRSAYACFLFAPSFFQHYDDGADQITSQDSEDSVRCKIGMKSVMTVFKSLSNLEKTVDQCKIKLNMKESRLVFQLHCRHGIVKTHNLAFIECETLQAVFSKDMCVNSLTASSKLLCDAVLNFQNNQEEVTLIVNPEKITLKNYVEDEPDPNKVMHTTLTLDPDEFDNCQVGVDTEVTFCLKELRAILAFSEVTSLPLTLHFETAGRPMVFSIDSDSTFEANFVLATLADQSDQSQATQPRMSTQKKQTQRSISRSNQPRPGTSRSSDTQHSRNMSRLKTNNRTRTEDRSERLDSSNYNELMGDDTDFTEMEIEQNTTLHIPRNTRTEDNQTTSGAKDSNRENNRENNRTSSGTDYQRPSIDKDNQRTSDSGYNVRPSMTGDDQSRANTNSKGDNDTTNINVNNVDSGKVTPKGDNVDYEDGNDTQVTSSSAGDGERSPVIPALGTKARILLDTTLDTTLNENVDMANDELDDTIPGTPPAKRFRSIFFGSSQSQSQSQQKHNLTTAKVLAADTDDEGD